MLSDGLVGEVVIQMTNRCSSFVGTAFLLVSGGAIHAQEQDADTPPTIAQQYVQVWLGTTDADGAWSVTDPATNSEIRGD